ncbi:MAG: electron transfer flavoprotein subunit alpha/FixB family protein [Balneolales bacterium]|nr:electron transfer flavoprotein subunit alpha/FixB family protein [Balneolales bacterium]
MSILVYISTTGGKIKRSALEVLSHCREQAAANNSEVAAVVLDADATSFTETLQSYGAKKIYTVSNPVFKTHLNAPITEALLKVIDQAKPSVFACASTEGTKDIIGALAAKTGAATLPDVANFELTSDGVSALRPVMAAKILSQNTASGDLVLVSVRSGSYDASQSPVVSETIAVDYSPSDFAQVLREVLSSAGDKVDLSEANVVIAAGRGIKDEAGKKLIEDLAESLGGAIGASRAVVENGMFPATAQIGQTGKVVSPELYFAIGISGAVQHTAGMSNSKVIVAINKDADAPIFQMASYGLVGDLYKILPILTEEIKKIRN